MPSLHASFYSLGVFLSLNGTVIPNSGYVVINDIGSTDDSALLCHTSRPLPPGHSNSGGDWFAPDGSRVDGTAAPGFTRNKGSVVVRLRKTGIGTPVEGIYKCFIADKTTFVCTTMNEVSLYFILA